MFRIKSFIFSNCNKNVDYTQLDDDIILQYILDNNLNAEPTGSGLYYVVNSTGNGDFPIITSFLRVRTIGP